MCANRSWILLAKWAVEPIGTRPDHPILLEASLSSRSTGPLAGVTVLDLSTVVFGPYATQLLGDMGADVIKVENGAGDIMRHAGDAPAEGMGAIYMGCNRNKRSILLDLKSEDGKEAMRRMLAKSDVFFTNVRMDGLERLGLGYDDVKALKEDILYVHCAGYGANGPYAGKPAYDDLIQAGSGVADLLAIREGGAPKYMPALVADKASGLHAAYAALAGLYAHQKTGAGQFIEVPMYEAFTSFNLVENLYGQTFVPPTGEPAYTRSVSANRKPYATKDGFIGLMPYNDAQWAKFFELGGRPEINSDPRFATYSARTQNIDVLYGLVGDVAATKTTDEWLTLLDDADIPAMRCNSIKDVTVDPHLRGSGFIHERDHPDVGKYLAMKHPVNFEKTPADIRREPPRLGEHTDEILRELGFDDDAVSRMTPAEKSS